MYIVTIEANTNPDSSGWGDFVTLENDRGELLFSGIGSTCPNSIQAGTGFNWRDTYGWIDKGVYKIRTMDHYKYGRCCIVEDGGVVSARFPNVNHNGRNILTEVFIHAGNRKSSNPEWRASAGCPTIHPKYWEKFVQYLPSGSGLLIIKDRFI